MDRFLSLIIILLVLVSQVKCYSNLELLEKQQPGVKPFEGHKVVRAFPKTKADVDFIYSLEENPDIEVDFWSRSRNIDIHVNPQDYVKLEAYLQRWNINSNVINDNIQKSIEEEQKGHSRHLTDVNWYSDYHKLEQIMEKLNHLRSLNPALAESVTIGKSYEDRDISGLELSDGKRNPNKQKIVVICGQHAREWISPATCVYIMEEMIKGYGTEANVTAMLNRFNWVFLPVVNPDGYVYTWEKERLWRKNRQPNGKSKCTGTDLNRNYGYRFGGSGSSDKPCSDIYRGSAAFSAPEVKAIADYVMANRDKIYGFLDMHSYSQLMMFPWSYSERAKAIDEDELVRVSNETVNALRSVYGTDYKTGAAAKIIYEAAGSGKDWVYGSMGIKYAFVFELRDTGDHGFLLPTAQIIPTGKETLVALHTLSQSMRDYGSKKTSL